MKQTPLLLTAALSLAAASAYAQAAKSSPAAGASASPSTPPTIASSIDREISIVEKEVLEAAEAMPEDKFDFSPEKLNLPGSDYKGVRTFGEQLKHIAASNYLIWSPITGEKPPDTVNDGKGPDNMKAKAEIIKYVKQSFAFGHKSVATLNSSNLVNRLPREVADPLRVCSWQRLPQRMLRSLRADDRVSANERYCPTRKPRKIGQGIDLPLYRGMLTPAAINARGYSHG